MKVREERCFSSLTASQTGLSASRANHSVCPKALLIYCDCDVSVMLSLRRCSCVSSRSLNTAFLCSYRPHSTVIHTYVYPLAQCRTFRENHVSIVQTAHVQHGEYLTMIGCDAPLDESFPDVFFFLPTQASLLPLTMKKLWLTSVCATQWLCSFKLVPWMSPSSQHKKEKTLQPHRMIL